MNTNGKSSRSTEKQQVNGKTAGQLEKQQVNGKSSRSTGKAVDLLKKQ